MPSSSNASTHTRTHIMCPFHLPSVHVMVNADVDPSFGTKWYVGTMLKDSARSGAGLPSGNGFDENSSPRDRVDPFHGAVARDLHTQQ